MFTSPSCLRSVPLSSSHAHTTVTSFHVISSCFPTFVVPLIVSFLILSSFITAHIHRSILIFAASNLFSCAFFNAHVSAPAHQCWSYHCSVHIPLDLHVHSTVAQHSIHYLPFLRPALHSVGDFRIQLSILRHCRSQV